MPTLQKTPPGLPLLNLRIGILDAYLLQVQNTVAVNFAGNPALAVPVPLRRELEIPDQVCVALYSGSLGKKQGLEHVVAAARAPPALAKAADSRNVRAVAAVNLVGSPRRAPSRSAGRLEKVGQEWSSGEASEERPSSRSRAVDCRAGSGADSQVPCR